MTTFDIAQLEEAIPELAMEDLHSIIKMTEDECYRRIAERRETCEHPPEHRGWIMQDRPGNRAEGCTYCITRLPGVSQEERLDAMRQARSQ